VPVGAYHRGDLAMSPRQPTHGVLGCGRLDVVDLQRRPRRGYGKGRSYKADQFSDVVNQPPDRLARAIVER
jgi:hypothetical protein